MPTPNQLLADISQAHVSISAHGEDCEYTPNQIAYALRTVNEVINAAYDASDTGLVNKLTSAMLALNVPIPSPAPIR